MQGELPLRRMFIANMCSDVCIIQDSVEHCGGQCCAAALTVHHVNTPPRPSHRTTTARMPRMTLARRHQLLQEVYALQSDSFHSSGVELCSRSLFMLLVLF